MVEYHTYGNGRSGNNKIGNIKPWSIRKRGQLSHGTRTKKSNEIGPFDWRDIKYFIFLDPGTDA